MKILKIKILFGLLLTLLLGAPRGSAENFATLYRITGTVQIKEKGSQKWSPARRGQKIKSGTQVKTNPQSSASLRTTTRHRVLMSPRTTIELAEDDPQKTTVDVFIGRIRSLVRKLKQQARYNVKTPVAVASVRGTVFDTDVADDGKSLFEVDKGHLGVKSLEGIGSEVSVFKGQKTVVERGLAPAKPEKMGMEMRQKLQRRAARSESKTLARLEARREIAIQNFKEFLQADVTKEQRISEYQDGKTVIDAFGMRVRIEEYIVRPQPTQFSFVTINTRLNNVAFSRYDAWANSALPSKIVDINRLFEQTGVLANKPSNYIIRQKWFTSNGGDIFREFSEGGDMVFFSAQSLWKVVFSHWYAEIKGADQNNFTLLSHWEPLPNYANGTNINASVENFLAANFDGAVDVPVGYQNYESLGDVGTLVGDNRPIDAVAFATRLDNANIFGSAAYQDSEGYTRQSHARFDDIRFDAPNTAQQKLDLILNAKESTAFHTYRDASNTLVTTLRVDEYMVDDLGNRLSLNDHLNRGASFADVVTGIVKDDVNFEHVATSPSFQNKIDLILTPRIFRKAGLIN